MPAIVTGKVLVTGSNGFIAGWIVKDLLGHGVSVRGSVRSADKIDALRSALKEHVDSLDFEVVTDITQDGAFDKAVQGIDAVVHVASPVTLSADDPEELIRPAVTGTTSILRSISGPRSSVKRVVVISSLAAVVDYGRPAPVVFSEGDWNESDAAEVETKGAAASQAAKYRTSKTRAERAAWDFYTQGKDRETITWDLVTLCPPWVFGPVLGARTPDDLNFSVGQWYNLVVKEEGELPIWSKALNWTDVRDFAEASRLALIKPQAGGERFIICAHPFVWDQWVHIVRNLLGKSRDHGFPKAAHDMSFDSTKSKEVLGVQYRSMEETAAFMLKDFHSRGWC